MYHAEYETRDGSLSWRKFNFCLPAIHACVGFKKSVNSFPETRARQHYGGKFFLAEMVEGSLKDSFIPL